MAFAIVCIILSVYLLFVSLAGLVCEFFESKEEKMMNEVLYKIKRAADLTGYDLAWLAIEWYVGTGRSTWRFDKALKRATPERLVKYIGDDGNYHSAINKAKQYLKRYCGYSEEA